MNFLANLAAVTPVTITAEELAPITDNVNAIFTVGNLATVVGIGLAASGTIALFYFGGRKIISMVNRAITKGRLGF